MCDLGGALPEAAGGGRAGGSGRRGLPVPRGLRRHEFPLLPRPAEPPPERGPEYRRAGKALRPAPRLRLGGPQPPGRRCRLRRPSGAWGSPQPEVGAGLAPPGSAAAELPTLTAGWRPGVGSKGP